MGFAVNKRGDSKRNCRSTSRSGVVDGGLLVRTRWRARFQLENNSQERWPVERFAAISSVLFLSLFTLCGSVEVESRTRLARLLGAMTVAF